MVHRDKHAVTTEPESSLLVTKSVSKKKVCGRHRVFKGDILLSLVNRSCPNVNKAREVLTIDSAKVLSALYTHKEKAVIMCDDESMSFCKKVLRRKHYVVHYY